MISASIKKRIVDETNIVEVVSEYVPLSKKGNSHFGICPFHADHSPSMSVSNRVKMYNCFSCGAKGDVISFVSKYEKISIDQACIKLAKRIGIEINQNVSQAELKNERLFKIIKEATEFYQFYLFNSDEGKVALEYLHKRGIDESIIKKFKIGLSPNLSDGLYQFLIKKNISELDMIELGLVKNNDQGKCHDVFRQRIMFPLENRFGSPCGFSGRIYVESDQAKYINSYDNAIFHKNEVLYNYFDAAKAGTKVDKIFLFEGFMDVIAAYKAGIDNGVATMGTALTKNHIQMLLNVTKNIVLCFDGDNAGINAMKRSSELLSYEGIIPESIVLPDGMDPDEYAKAHGDVNLYGYLQTKSEPVYNKLYEVAYSKVIKSDFVSVENFKKEVFSFLNYVKEQTIIEHFIDKIAKDLDVDVEIIKKDFIKLNRNNINNVQNQPNGFNYEVSKEEIITPTINSGVPVTKAVREAYKVVIKHAMHSASKLQLYVEKSGEVYPGNDLCTEYSILSWIKYQDTEHQDLIENEERFNYLLENIIDPSFKKYLNNIDLNLGDNMIEEEDFNQCLDRVKTYIDKVKVNYHKVRVLNGDDSSLDSFVLYKKISTKVK